MLEQEKLIARVKANAAADERIVAVLMYGSFTQSAGDAFSDVEFYIFVDDDAFAKLDTCNWINGIAPIHTHFYNIYGTEVVIFQTLVRGEFHFLTAGELSIIESFASVGYFPEVDSACLYDRDGQLRVHLTALAAKAQAVRRDNEETAAYTLNNCLNLLLLGSNVLRRGEVARAWETLAQAQTFYVQLVRLHEGATHHWLNPMKNLEREISGPAYQHFAAGVAGLDVQGLERAYHN